MLQIVSRSLGLRFSQPRFSRHEQAAADVAKRSGVIARATPDHRLTTYSVALVPGDD